MKKIIAVIMIAGVITGFTACSEPKPATETTPMTDSSAMDNKPDTSMMQPSTQDTLHNN